MRYVIEDKRFVTNGSSSSFLTINVNSPRAQEMLKVNSADELNEMLEQALAVAYEEFAGDELPFADDDRFDYNSITEYLFFLLQMSGVADADIATSAIADSDLQSVEIDHAEFDDGSYGPFEYIRINNGKKLTIRVEETYDDDAYKGEDIKGMEFYIVGKPEEYDHLDEIRGFILSHGATISDTLSDKTRYVVCPCYCDREKALDRIREKCVPILLERAFMYRFLDERSYDDIYNIAYMVGFQDLPVCVWFELFGLGDTEIEYWKDGQWVRLEDRL